MATNVTVVLTTLVIYKVLLIAIGLWANRRTVAESDFYLGGRKLGPWVAAISASASSSSAWTLLGVSGAAYSWGLSAIWLFPACLGGFMVNWYLVAPRLRRLSAEQESISLTDVLAAGVSPRQKRAFILSASSIILFSLLFYVASQFQGAGKTFVSTFDFPLVESVVVGGAIVMFYTVIGGFWAVSVTDTLQGLIMAATAFILPITMLVAIGSPSDWLIDFRAAYANAPGHLLRHGWSAAGLGFVLGLLGIGLGYPGQPHVVNRFMALKDENSVVNARRIAIGWAIIIYPGMLVTGWAGRMLFSDIGDSETIFIQAANELLHPVAAGIMIAAVLSAIMSTADSQLLVAASSVTSDWQRDRSKPHLWTSRAVVVGLCIAAIVLALTGTQKIFSKVLFAWSAMGAAFGPALLVRLWRGPISGPFLLASTWLGFTASVAATNLVAADVRAIYGGVLERVVPFLLALLVAWWGSHRQLK